MNYAIIGFLSNEGLRLDKSLPRLETFTDGTSFLKEISKHYQVVYYYNGDTCLKFGKVDSIRWLNTP